MKTISGVILIFLVFVAGIVPGAMTQENGSEIKRFVFGTVESVVRPGFTKVTSRDGFTAQRGFGFESTQGLLVRFVSEQQLILAPNPFDWPALSR